MPTNRLVLCLAFVKIALQLATAGRYGIFRDELYYLACADHLDVGYVDHPPLIAWISWAVSRLFGTTLLALRLLPALAGGALVWMTAGLAREIGGTDRAQVLAALAIIPVPVYMLLQHWLTMNAFEPLLWSGLFWMVLRLTHRQDPRLWLAIGALCGVGLLNKYSMALPMLALAVMLLARPERRLLASRWLLAGASLCGLIVLPNLIWQIQHDFPFIEFESHSRLAGSRILRGPLAFVLDQIVMMNPLTAPLWIGGVVVLVRRFRLIGLSFLAIFTLMVVLQAKNYYLAPLYPIAFAAGAVWLERWDIRAYAGGLLAAGALLAPLVLPILPISDFLTYRQALGGLNPVRIENLPEDRLPLHFADEFGWEEMAAETARIYASLPEDERRDTAIFANNYGEAGAIDYFGAKYGLPKAISNHVSYWLWGPRAYAGGTVIVLGSDGAGDREHFRTVEAVGRVDDPRARSVDWFDVFLCRGLSPSLGELWPRIRRF